MYMKTIDEACKECVAEAEDCLAIFEDDYSKGYISGLDTGFRDGVKFAQQWISVEDELPPCSDEDILIKGIDYRGHEGIVDIGYMHGKTPRVENFISLSGEVVKVTHWRQIELK
jgi:hypothetical protein